MSWKEDRLDWLRRIIIIEKENLGDHLRELASLEEEITKEKKLNEENKKLRSIIENLEKKRRNGDK